MAATFKLSPPNDDKRCSMIITKEISSINDGETKHGVNYIALGFGTSGKVEADSFINDTFQY